MAVNTKIAVLGSNGTIGKVLMKRLQNHEPVGIHRDICDLRDRNSLDKILQSIKPDVVVLCATAGGKQSMGSFSHTDLHDNMKVIQNLESLSDRYGWLINIGSGAEFDVKRQIKKAKEDMIYERLPEDSYGMSKNIISRICRRLPNATTLRIFGCFDSAEPDFRLLKSYIKSMKSNSEYMLSRDRNFSWISTTDLSLTIEHIAINRIWEPRDLNCAYDCTPLLSETIETWCKLHNYSPSFSIVSSSDFEYTADTSLFKSIAPKNLNGYELSLKEYTL